MAKFMAELWQGDSEVMVKLFLAPYCLDAGKGHGAAAEGFGVLRVWGSFGGFCGLANGRLERS